ncbi:MAG: MoxR family ATPase, partial [Acidimicrobiia bacterium]|nr:MoxR family ATPase [Acidimicrobiia bacterium]
SPALARAVAGAAAGLRSIDLYKPPGVAETIDWASALARLGHDHLDDATVTATLGVVLKYREDHARVREMGIAEVLAAGVHAIGH